MSEETLIHFCSPTLAGLKTGSLFSCSFESRTQMNEELRHYNSILVPKELCILPLQYDNGRGLIYLFRPHMLACDLSEETAAKILEKAGYSGTVCCMLRCLMGRIGAHEGFPHEIGLFLSYPPEDVLGFIHQKACNYKCIGCWKVYGNVEAAQKKFDAYQYCEAAYRRSLACGYPFEYLAVRMKRS